MHKHHLLLLWLVLTCVYCKNSSEMIRPNIIIMNVDDLGWRDLGFMGSKYYETPNIDKLSKQGMYFTNGYAAAANCAPSRASLMTGKWPTYHEIYTVGSSQRGKSRDRMLIPTENNTTLSEDEIVIAEVLKNNGYHTIHAGKWHISESPLNFGFEVNIAGGSNGHPKSYYPPYRNVKIEGEKNLTDLIMEKTIQRLKTIEQPFFLNYAPYAVHTPIQPIDNLLPKYKDKTPWNGQENVEYATMIENLDRNIGLLIATLHEKAVFENTIIIFTSDNGGLFGITNQHPLRAGKGSYYEGGIREPFFFVWQGKIQSNAKSDVPITNLDIFPTLLAFTKLEGEKLGLDGANLKPILTGQITELDRPLYWHFPIYLQAYKKQNKENRDPLFRTRPGSVIRNGKWKLHYYFEKDEVELYNLEKDIGERNNLAQMEKTKAKELLQNLQKWWKETNAPIPKELNPEYQE